MTNQPMLELNNGVRIPQLGFGTFRVDAAQTQRAVETALEVGYRHVDTASAYYNEAGVGAALKASGLPREEVFVTTKLRNGDQGYDRALRAFEDSRAALGVDVVDLYLIHWPSPAKGLYKETWRALEKLYADGAVRAIGISNFMPEHVEDLLREAEVTPAVDQVEVHPSFQQRDAQRAATDAGMVVEAYAPLGQAEDLALPGVVGLAEALAVTPAQVVLRWQLQQGRVALPKSVTPERIATNFDVLGFELDETQLATLDGLDTDARMFPDPRTAEFTQVRD